MTWINYLTMRKSTVDCFILLSFPSLVLSTEKSQVDPEYIAVDKEIAIQ